MKEPINILHLEDDPIDAELIQATLDSAGISYKIVRVQTAQKFNDSLRKGGFDLILADFKLPSYDGISAMYVVREQYPNIPFIFVSGTMGEDAAIKALTEGATDYVLKQKLSRLAPAISRALLDTENRAKRQQAEDALKKNNVLLERIFSTTEFMLAYLDADFNFIRVNRAYAEISEEKEPEYFEGKNHFELYPNPENEAIFHHVIETGEPFIAYAKPFEYADHPERGTTYWNWSLHPVKDENDRVNGLVLSLIDVTERERAYITLRQREEQLRLQGAALEAAASGIIITGRDGKIIWANSAMTHLTGYLTKQIVGKKPSIFKSGKHDLSFYKELWNTIIAGEVWQGELVNRHKDGHFYTEEVTISPLRDEGGEVSHFIAIKQDITERKQMEEALVEREREFRTLAENSPDNIARYDSNCRTLYVNPALEKTLEGPASKMIGTTPIEAALINDAKTYQEKIAEVFETGKDDEMDLVLPDKGEGVRFHNIRFVAERGEKGEITGVQTIGRDITESKQAEIERQAHLHFLESMDHINRAIQGANGLDQMMSEVLDIVLSVFDCDRAFLIYPCDPNAPLWYSPMERNRSEYPGVFTLGNNGVPMDEEVAETFRILLETDGPVKFGPGNTHPLPHAVSEQFSIRSFMSMALHPKMNKPWQFGIHQCSYERAWTPKEERLFQEIGRRLSDALTSLLAFRNLQESEERYRQLVDVSPDAIITYGQGRVEFANPAAVRLAGATSIEDIVGKSISDFIHPDLQEYSQQTLEQMQKMGETALFFEDKYPRVDGSRLDVEGAMVSYQFHGESYVQIVARDITERKQHEREREAIIMVSTALRQVTTRDEILDVILNQLIDLFDANGAVLVMPDPQTRGFIHEIGRGAVGERMVGLSIPSGKGVGDWVIKNKKPYLNNRADEDPLFYRPDLLGDYHCVVSVPLLAEEHPIGAIWIARKVAFNEQDLRLLTAISDIAANAIHRITLFEQTEQQLHRLIALHQIDLAISTNFDLNVTLNVILSNVIDELEVNAASILLLNSVTHTLDYVAGIGFRTPNIERSHVKIGKGCAGCAAQEQRTVSWTSMVDGSKKFMRSELLASEKFVSHYATPLVVKGQVKGVLEIFHRAEIDSEHTWISYFETLATQAAIAIENSSLFANLQRSHTELTLAYDDTIEGWSRALDLRDKETEGHTQRVVEKTLALAEKMGMNNAEKTDLRRGVLLHDIGKMGVPDGILLKPGPLSDDEWEIMQQHPLYAYQMLSPITYLKRALEIPYCHHEKWDGTGYPRGLKGAEIPLSARVFAVVDVFDALTSDRPYRKAWPKDEAYHYIEEQAGKHFDPQVVQIFLNSK